MKLRNFMYATMIACAFASCSKDEATDPNPEAKGEGELTISFETATAETKALGAAISNESAINTLDVFIYAENGTQLQHLKYNAETIGAGADKGTVEKTVTGLVVGTKIKCYAYANIANVKDAATYGEALSVTFNSEEGTGFVNKFLPMAGDNSEDGLITVSGTVANTANIELVRAVSRVDVKKIALDVTKGSLKDLAKNASFQLEGLSINRVQSASTTVGVSTDTFWGGEAASSIWGNSVQKAFFVDAVASDKKDQTIESGKGTEVVIAEAAENSSIVSYYVFPTTGGDEKSATLLVKGLFGYETPSTIYAPAESIYPISVAKDGTVSGTDNGVIGMNKAIAVEIVIAGWGQNGGNKAELTVKTTVADYTPITQKVVVE